MFLLSTVLDMKNNHFFQLVIIVELGFMKTEITPGHGSTWINLSTLHSWKHDTHETNNALQLQVNQEDLHEVFKKYYLLRSITWKWLGTVLGQSTLNHLLFAFSINFICFLTYPALCILQNWLLSNKLFY